MNDIKGKKLLILGGKAASVNVVKQAKKMGLYTIVSNITPGGQAWNLADETLTAGSEEHEKLVQYIKKNHIDGVMTGSAEFQIINMIQLCEKADLPCYASMEQWNICQDKRNFKDLCKKYNVPGVPEFQVEDELYEKDFPVIVKPVDGCSSIGITVCRNNDELRIAKVHALNVSQSKKILIERYIDNGGLTHVIKYVVVNGKFYMQIMGDRYVLNNGLITAVTFFPSKNTQLYLDTIDSRVRDMFLSINYKNGVFFFQAIPEQDNIYIYEMGLRTGGGMTYKLTQATTGNNDLEMLIRYAITGKMCEQDDLKCIDPFLNGKKGASLAIPLRTGTIAQIKGANVITKIPGVINFTNFCEEGSTIEVKHINTLSQLYGRIMVVKDNEKELYETLHTIRHTIKINDTLGNDMIIWDTFDEIYNEFQRNNEK